MVMMGFIKRDGCDGGRKGAGDGDGDGLYHLVGKSWDH